MQKKDDRSLTPLLICYLFLVCFSLMMFCLKLLLLLVFFVVVCVVVVANN